MNDPMPLIVRGDAGHLPLPDASVDLIVTSPPYFGLRSYSDGGEHYQEQIGSEPTPGEFLDALIECTREMSRVLKPTGSIWVNLGDKYAGTGGGGGGSSDGYTGRHDRPARRGSNIPAKSLMLLPHRYAIRCIDDLGLIVRQDQVWSKPSALPESVTDRTRRSHEYLFHMVKQPQYYSAIDEIRVPHAAKTLTHRGGGRSWGNERNPDNNWAGPGVRQVDPLGALPGSVFTVASQPLNVPDRVAHTRCCGGSPRPGCEDGLDHYAAFPMDLIRPIILGWSPREVCTVCGDGMRPTADRSRAPDRPGRVQGRGVDALLGGHGQDGHAGSRFSTRSTITGYACGCGDCTTLRVPGVVVDPFGGTGTAALVAAMNGRTGISVDYSWDYCDVLARWRVRDPKERARAAGLDAAQVSVIAPLHDDQGSLMDLLVSGAS
ncbi:MAG: DNA-methyltransferase [Pseudonocardiaceae bacterium]